jgi:hypothetical protein
VRVEILFCYNGVEPESPDIVNMRVEDLLPMVFLGVDAAWARRLVYSIIFRDDDHDLLPYSPYPVDGDDDKLRIIVRARRASEHAAACLRLEYRNVEALAERAAKQYTGAMRLV